MFSVYLSSSFRDLKEERAAILAQLSKQKDTFQVVNMEDYPPESTPPAEKCVADVESCHIYVGLFAWRYGSIEEKTGKSITELELLAAESKKIEILVYLLEENAPWPRTFMDRDLSNIERMREYASKNHTCEEFKSKEELCAKVVTGINAAQTRLTSTNTLKPTPSGNQDEDLRRSYLKWLQNCHQRLEFRGIHHAGGGTVSVELQQVYVALQADSTNPLERAAARRAVLDELEEVIRQLSPEDAQFAAWYVISGSPIMPSLEARDRMSTLDPSGRELLNLADAYFRESQLVILGDPGSGKTTLARWLTLISANELLKGRRQLVVPLHHVDPQEEDQAKTASLGNARLPILIRISEYAEYRQRETHSGKVPPTLFDFLGYQTWLRNVPVWDRESANDGQRLPPPELQRMLHQALRDGEALIILDGLDEIPASALRDEIVEEVDAFAQHWIQRRHFLSGPANAGSPFVIATQSTANTLGNRLIVTSRIAGYHLSALHGDLAHVTIEPMSTQAVSIFISNWMKAVHQRLAPIGTAPESTLLKAAEEAGRFMEVLSQPRQRGARELATNPLLAGILATVFQGKGELPQERVELYRQAVEIFLNIWTRRQRETQRINKYELFEILEPLAEHIHRYEPTGLIPENEMRDLAQQHLAESRGENPRRPSSGLRQDVDEFLRIIQEDVGLVAARGEGVYGFLHLTFQEYLAARSLVRDPAKASSRILNNLGDARWRETLRLALGHLNTASPKDFDNTARELLLQKGLLGDLLPQAALTLIGAIPDLRLIDSSLAELLTEQVVVAYSDRPLSQRLPRRRALLEKSLKALLSADFGSAAEEYLARVVEDAAGNAQLAGSAAQLVLELKHYTSINQGASARYRS